MKVVVAQLGARMHYAVPKILQQSGRLERLYTDTYVGNKPYLNALLSRLPPNARPRILRRLLGRSVAGIPSEKVTSFEALGLVFKVRRRLSSDNAKLDRIYADTGRLFCERVIANGYGEADAIWCFNGAALELFQHGRSRGKLCVLEQTMAPHAVNARLMRSEEIRWPQYVLPARTEFLKHTSAREEAEWSLADIIVCPSQFVVDGIRERGGPVERCRVIPYGVDNADFPGGEERNAKAQNGKLRVLFCGEVGLRKGAPYLLEALEQLGPRNVEARFAGDLAIPPAIARRFGSHVKFEGRVPRAQINALYQWADVLVLPSICEGSATVIYEALSAGLPVICTPNAGPPDDPRITTVPAGDLDGLLSALKKTQEPRAGSKAQDREDCTLAGYGERVLGVIAELEGGATFSPAVDD